jgi:hypothetical protein
VPCGKHAAGDMVAWQDMRMERDGGEGTDGEGRGEDGVVTCVQRGGRWAEESGDPAVEGKHDQVARGKIKTPLPP